MPEITFTGPRPLVVHDVGEWNPGESKAIGPDLADRLLARPDFTKTQPKKIPAKASPAKAKTPA